MGIRDPHDNRQILFQEVWTGASDNKTHFIVTTEQETTAAECMDIMGQIITTQYDMPDNNRYNRYWSWFTKEHQEAMSKLIYDQVVKGWSIHNNDPLQEVLKAKMEMQLVDENFEEEEAPICMITGIQIVDAHWTTSRMGGVQGD
jgi:hypothetical protein